MGHVRKTPGLAWQARYRDPTGRERARNFSRKADAERFLALAEADKLRGEWVDPRSGKVTVAELAERWFATTVPLKPKTRSGYRSLLDSRVLPILGWLELRQVDPVVVREWVATLQSAGLSASRVRQARNVLHAVFSTAVDASLTSRNPVTGVKTQRVVSAERRFLSPEQVVELAVAMKAPYDVLIYVLAYTGIRIGEAFALRRGRCDTLRSRLVIAESLAEVSGALHFGPTKTYRQRTVILPRAVGDLLSSHLEEVESEGDALVFTSPTGKPLRYSNFRNRIWKPATKAAGLGDLDVHELRHTAASLMIAGGADPKLIQSQLGHSSISVTYDIYGHLFPDRLDELGAGLDDLFRSARTPGEYEAAGSLATVTALKPPV